MQTEDFAKICSQEFDSYLRYVAGHDKAGNLQPHPGCSVFYPSVLMCTQASRYLIAELYGAMPTYRGLTVVSRSQKSVGEYFYQFSDDTPDDGAVFAFAGTGARLSKICMSHQIDFADAERRFPALKDIKSRLVRSGGSGALISFKEGFVTASMEGCILINSSGPYLRAKFISYLLIVKKAMQKNELRNHFLKTLQQGVDGEVHLVTTAPSGDERRSIASQLQSFYLTPHVHETSIGRFIERHPEIIYKAFSTDKFVYEPTLDWIRSPSGKVDPPINPDLMFRGSDGSYDILDYKTALLHRISVTKGERRRRQFIDALQAALSQVAHYAEYFEFPENCEFAAQKYGIEIRRPPRLYVVAGHSANVSPNEVSEALRSQRADISVMDYDTLVQTYLADAAIPAAPLHIGG